MYILVLRWGSRSSRNYFSNVKTKAVASVGRKRKQCAMPSIAALFEAAKRSFRDVLLDLVGIHFRICGFSIDPGHLGDVFDVGCVTFERSPEAAISHRSRCRSVSCDRVNVNKPKLRNYNRPLGLPGHLQ